MTDTFDRRPLDLVEAARPASRKVPRAVLPQDHETARLRMRGTLSLKSFWKAVDGD